MEIHPKNLKEVLDNIRLEKIGRQLTEIQPADGAIKVPYAERNGRLIHISRVERGLACQCVCPVCKTAVIARKGKKLRHHFSHHSRGNCSAETVLHQIAKILIYEKIIGLLKSHETLPITWKCALCRDMHRLNLLENVSTIEMEKPIDTIRPDIVLLNADSVPTAAIEIAVTHDPEPEVLETCEKRNIPLLIFTVRSAEDLESLGESTLIHPTSVRFCLKKHCPGCGGALFIKTVFVVDDHCWRCGSPMNLAFMEVGDVLHGPENFSENEQMVTRKSGVLLKIFFDHQENRRFLANVCPACGISTGSAYLRSFKRLERKLKGEPTGFLCGKCGKHFT
ncbi:MAG: competence protein CoiA family protein [Candidatus Neomarinimicrobiota bacterium]